jgi:hypothetical protein
MKFGLSTLLATTAVAALLPLAAAHAAVITAQGTWKTTLQPRDIDGNGTVDAFYDTVLNISWLADANAVAGTIYDTSQHTSSSDGYTNWYGATDWVASLNGLYGKTGWRLPKLIDTGDLGFVKSGGEGPPPPGLFGGTDTGYNVQTISADGKTVYSEMAHLYYVTLGNQAGCTVSRNCSARDTATTPDYLLSNTGDFRNLRPANYWLDSYRQNAGVLVATPPYVHVPFGAGAWAFFMAYGLQKDGGYRDGELSAMAVFDGDVGAVPEPQTYALLLAGVGVVALAARRRTAGGS